MKYKKYILVLLLVIFIGLNKVEAGRYDKCFYMSDNLNATFEFNTGSYQDVYIDEFNGNLRRDKEDLLNWRPLASRPNKTIAGFKFKDLYSSAENANKNGDCPNYLVVQHCNGRWQGITPVDAYRVWGTNDVNEAIQAVNGINSEDKCSGAYASYKDANGNKITGDDYYAVIIRPTPGGQELPNDSDEACKQIFGDKDYAGETDVDTNGNGVIDPPSIAYLINSVLKYIRVIVPILIILLGSFDLAKAVVAAKEDEMKKAQKTFFKRLIAGVIIFFVPVIVNLVMYLANIVWDGMGFSHCNLS